MISLSKTDAKEELALDLDRILRDNPNTDRKQLEEVLAIIAELRAMGIREDGYSLAPPFSRMNMLASRQRD